MCFDEFQQIADFKDSSLLVERIQFFQGFVELGNLYINIFELVVKYFMGRSFACKPPHALKGRVGNFNRTGRKVLEKVIR